MFFGALLFLGGVFIVLCLMIWAYNRLVWQRARAHQWWNHVDACRSGRHSIIRDLVNISYLPLQHAQAYLALLEQNLSLAEQVSGMEGMLTAEMNLTDAITDLENFIDTRPPRYEEDRIRAQLRLVDMADRRLDDSRLSYNKAAARVNQSLSSPIGRMIGYIFKITPMPYFHHNRIDNQDAPLEELPAPENPDPAMTSGNTP